MLRDVYGKIVGIFQKHREAQIYKESQYFFLTTVESFNNQILWSMQVNQIKIFSYIL